MYDYKCLDCKKDFLVALTLKEHESGFVTCPSCGSKNVKHVDHKFCRQDDQKELTP